MRLFLNNVFFLIILGHYLFAQNYNLPLSAIKFTYKDPEKSRLLTEIDISFTQSKIDRKYLMDTLDIKVDVYYNGALITRGWHWLPLKSYIENNKRDIFLDSFTFALLPGQNDVRISINNRYKQFTLSGNLKEIIDIPKVDTVNTFISDLLISDIITKPETMNDRFIKNNIFIQPYPFKIFTPKKATLFYYVEIYNLPNLINYRLNAEIFDSENQKIRTLKSPKINSLKDSRFALAGQNVMGLKDGTYILKVTLYNDNKIIDSSSESFTIIKKKIKNNIAYNNDEIDPEYIAKNEEEINSEIYALKYILKEKTWKNFQQMDITNKRRNLAKFWKRNDYTKETAENEFKKEYLDLINYVREKYSKKNIDGVDTDMGRIVLLYGKPDYVNRKTDEDMAGQSVELWRYNKYQSYFLFVQENYTGPYHLVHSTMRGEIYDPFWAEYLKSNPGLLEY